MIATFKISGKAFLQLGKKGECSLKEHTCTQSIKLSDTCIEHFINTPHGRWSKNGWAGLTTAKRIKYWVRDIIDGELISIA